MMYCILVIYNKRVVDVPAFQNLDDCVHFVVCDNSTEPNDNQQIVENGGHTYFSMGGNQGLSKAYNRAIQSLRDMATIDDYVLFMDDDTFVDKSYVEYLNTHCQWDVNVPIVLDQQGQMSPCIIENGIVKRGMDVSKMSAINSGMCISMRVFEAYEYDERLFLDYIDHKFLLDIKENGFTMGVLDYTIQQDFSANSTQKDQLLTRFDIFKKDSKVFYIDFLKNRRSYFYVVGKRKLRLVLQCKDLRILFR